MDCRYEADWILHPCISWSSFQSADWEMGQGQGLVTRRALPSRLPWVLPAAVLFRVRPGPRHFVFPSTLSMHTPLALQPKPLTTEQGEVLEMLQIRNTTPDHSLVSQRSWSWFFTFFFSLMLPRRPGVVEGASTGLGLVKHSAITELWVCPSTPANPFMAGPLGG